MRSSLLFISLCALVTVSGCAYIIPPEPSAPRHNTVLGGPRRPQLNLISGPLSAISSPTTNAGAVVASAPVEPVSITAQAVSSAPALAPVDAAVKAQTERALQASAPRNLPPENQQFQVAGNYPALDSVPPRPALTGTDSAQSRLSATQVELERGRALAEQNKNILARDAAAEPSLLAPQPPNLPPAILPVDIHRTPASGGTSLAPLTSEISPVAASQAPRITLPTIPPQNDVISLPAVPSFAPPAPLTVANLTAPQSPPVRIVPTQQPVEATREHVPAATPIPAIVAPTGQASRITLRPPVDYEANPVNTQLTPATSTVPFGGITVQPGDFNPLTGGRHSLLTAPTNRHSIRHSVSNNAPLAEYANSVAIAPSRYGASHR